MGKKLLSQRRGKGSPTFIAKRGGIDTEYISIDHLQKEEMVLGEVIGLVKDSGRTNILAEVWLGNGKNEFVVAAEGMSVGQRIEQGRQASVEIGNVLFLRDIPEGCPIFNIERTPGDGGSLAKGTGVYGFIATKGSGRAFVRLSSGKTVQLSLDARATIGNAAGGGRKEKPFVKAGARWHFFRARNRKYPRVRGVAMNAIDHPFGGSQHHPGKSKSTSRNAPPGRKVGAIASSRTGRRKKN